MLRSDVSRACITSWAIQLQDTHPSEVAKTGFDLMIMDYSRDGSKEGKYTEGDISKIRSSGKLVLSYMSIGEAEDYRFYWRREWYENPPDWLGPENPEWKGNYATRYWQREWKKIVFQYLEEVKREGFDGVYLDKVDEFEYWADVGVASEETLASSMVSFIEDISERAGTMLIIIQNGERLLEFRKYLLRFVNGIGVEDLWYNGTREKKSSEIATRLKYIRKFDKAGKIVLVIDYVDDGRGYSGENLKRIESFISKSRREGFIPYVAKSDRKLDEIVIIPGIQPPEGGKVH